MTETAPLSPSTPARSPAGDPGESAEVNVTRLLAEAATRSDVAWLRLPDGSTHPMWFVWHDDGDLRGPGPVIHVVSGPGEQTLPWLPPEVEVILRSKDSRNRLLTVAASVTEIRPDSPRWDAAVAVLRAERLNAIGDVRARWRESSTIHLIAPHGRLLAAADQGVDRRLVEPSPGTTAGRSPWHWRGRPQRRRGTP